MKPTDMRKNITDTTWGIPLNRQVTLGYFKIDMAVKKYRQGTLPFLKIDRRHREPPIKGPKHRSYCRGGSGQPPRAWYSAIEGGVHGLGIHIQIPRVERVKKVLSGGNVWPSVYLYCGV